MYSFKELGQSTLWFVGSIRIFFRFQGHFFSSFIHGLTGSQAISWPNFIKTMFYSGAHLVLTVIVISFLIGLSLSLSLFSIFNEINSGGSALIVTQSIVISNIAPLLIGVLLSIQSALNLINANVRKLQLTPDEVMCEYIIPISLSLFINALLLYAYYYSHFLLPFMPLLSLLLM